MGSDRHSDAGALFGQSDHVTIGDGESARFVFRTDIEDCLRLSDPCPALSL
jgi:hypothetical protein